MSLHGGKRAFDELERVGSRIAAGRPSGGRLWEPLRALLSDAARAPEPDFDRALLKALERPGPCAAALLALRLGLRAGLSGEAALDLGQAAMLARTDLSALADSRIRRRGGAVPRADVVRLALSAGERLDGGGPLGLRGEELDAPTRLLAAAWAYLDARASADHAAAVAALSGQPQLFSAEAAALLRAAVPSRAPAAEPAPRPEPAPAPAPPPPAPEPRPDPLEGLAERMRLAVEEEGRRAAAAEAAERRRRAAAEAAAAFAAGLRAEFERLRAGLAEDRSARAGLRSMREEVEKAARLLGATEAEVESFLASGVSERLSAARERQVERLERVAGVVRRRRERLAKAAAERAAEREAYARRLRGVVERAARAKRRALASAEAELARLQERVAAERARLEALRGEARDPWAEAASDLARRREEWEAQSPAASRRREEARLELEALDRELADLAALLADLGRRRDAEASEHEAAMAALRAAAALELRRARGGPEAGRLRLRLESARRRLEEERLAAEHFQALGEEERRRVEAAASELRGRLDAERARWDRETEKLRAQVLERKRLVDDARRSLAELSRRREEAQASARAERTRFDLEAAARLAEVRRALRQRRELLAGALAGLEERARQAAERTAEAAASYEERRARLERELTFLRAEAGDLRGRLAAGLSEHDALRRTLESALSELDLSLTEAYFAADGARRELASLRIDRDRLGSELDRARRELEPLAARFEEDAGALDRQLDALRELSGEKLGGLSALLQGRLLAGARGLETWLARAAEAGRRLAAARRALDAELFERCREAALRALAEGRPQDAREALRQALALREDAELRAALARLEPQAPAEPEP